MQGAPNELSKSGIDFATLLQTDDPVDNNEDSASMGKRSRTHSGSSIRSSKSGDVKDETTKEKSKSVEQVLQLEASSKGKVKGSVGGAYLKSGANLCILLVILALFLMTQVIASGADYWVSFWTGQEELRQFYRLEETGPAPAAVVDANFMNEFLPNMNESQLSNRTKEILTSPREGSFFDSVYGLLSTEACMYIHGILMASLFIFALVRSLSFYTVCVRASQKLHDNMFKGMISTSMRFFDTNPAGRILNRFSKDMGAADEFLPKAVLDATQIILNMFGAIVVTAIVNPLFLVPVAVLSIVFIGVRKVYLKTSKNIKRLEGTSK